MQSSIVSPIMTTTLVGKPMIRQRALYEPHHMACRLADRSAIGYRAAGS